MENETFACYTSAAQYRYEEGTFDGCRQHSFDDRPSFGDRSGGSIEHAMHKFVNICMHV
jgi:hypothetical protein